MFRRFISAAGQSRSAKTVEVFGWLILLDRPPKIVEENFYG